MVRALVAAGFALVAPAACSYDVRLTDCTIRCAADETLCPDGMTCGSENLCRPSGASEACDGGNACMNVGDPLVDLALGRTVWADQVIDAGGVAENANDGNDATRWNAGDSVPGHFWVVDLGADRLLTSVNTLWEVEGINYQYDVSISSDGTVFTVAIDNTADTRTARARTDTFSVSTCTRFVRIRKTDVTSYWSILYTVNVMGR